MLFRFHQVEPTGNDLCNSKTLQILHNRQKMRFSALTYSKFNPVFLQLSLIKYVCDTFPRLISAHL